MRGPPTTDVNLPSYQMYNMKFDSHTQDDLEHDQEEALLGEFEAHTSKARPYANSTGSLWLMGCVGSIILLFCVFNITHSFAGHHAAQDTMLEITKSFGQVGCLFPHEAISPVLEQNLTTLDGRLEVVIFGQAIGVITLYTEREQLDYVRLDISLEGKTQTDLETTYTRVRDGRYELQSPDVVESCLRYELSIWLPPNLEMLYLETSALAHIDMSHINLSAGIKDLSIIMRDDSWNNMLILPEMQVDKARYNVVNGNVIGTTLLYESLEIITDQARSNVEAVIMPDQQKKSWRHLLSTSTNSTGSNKFIVKNPIGAKMEASHVGFGGGSLSLYYPASFSGTISTMTDRLSGKNMRVDLGKQGIGFREIEGQVISKMDIKNENGAVFLAFE